MTEPVDPFIAPEATPPLLPAPSAKRRWKERLPDGVVRAVDRAFDAADEVADGLRKAASDVARAARDATR